MEVGRAADAGELAALLQLGGDGDGVGRLAAPIEVEDRVVDQLVGGTVEVVAAHRLDDVGDGVLGEQHAAEHGLLGDDVLRGSARELARPLLARELRNAHRTDAPCFVIVRDCRRHVIERMFGIEPGPSDTTPGRSGQKLTAKSGR